LFQQNYILSRHSDVFIKHSKQGEDLRSSACNLPQTILVLAHHNTTFDDTVAVTTLGAENNCIQNFASADKMLEIEKHFCFCYAWC